MSIPVLHIPDCLLRSSCLYLKHVEHSKVILFFTLEFNLVFFLNLHKGRGCFSVCFSCSLSSIG